MLEVKFRGIFSISQL